MALVRGATRPLGVDFFRYPRVEERTLLGISQLPVRTILDVGAHEGEFARVAHTVFPNAKIYAFEPQPAPFSALKAWAEASGGGRVVPFNVALGELKASMEFNVHLANPSSSSLLAATDKCLELFPFTAAQASTSVPVERLDDLVVQRDLALAPDLLLKLDVQGFEDRVLRGGRETLSKAAACIVEICLDPLYEGQATFSGLRELLEGSGLRYVGNWHQIPAPDGHIIYLDAVFLRPRQCP